jgi:hypothetical protein
MDGWGRTLAQGALKTSSIRLFTGIVIFIYFFSRKWRNWCNRSKEVYSIRVSSNTLELL